MKLLYITFIDFGEQGSGSSVRPHKMYDAFKAEGCDIRLLECRQNRRQLRRRRVREVLRELSGGYRPDICYVEPPSGPFFNRIDLKLLKRLYKLGVPTGLFYRDAHWRFAAWWGVKGLKKLVLTAMHRRDIRVFRRCCGKVYFPSQSMGRLFEKEFPENSPLPPGCEEPPPARAGLFGRAVYVGGVSEHYGAGILLEAFERLNAGGDSYPLLLVCRKKEWEAFESPYKARPWLTISHASGGALASLYAESDVGLLPLKRDAYMDFAMPVKLFEYLGHGLPVAVTGCAEMAAFVRRYDCGIVCEDNAESFARGVRDFYKDAERRGTLFKNAANAARENLWSQRAKTVIADLTRQGASPEKSRKKGAKA